MDHLRQTLRLHPDPVAVVEPVVDAHHRLLPPGGLRRERLGLERGLVDPERAVELAGIGQCIGQPGDELPALGTLGGPLEVGETVVRAIEPDVHAGQVDQRLGAEVEERLRPAGAPVHHPGQLLPRALEVAEVEVAPGQLVGGVAAHPGRSDARGVLVRVLGRGEVALVEGVVAELEPGVGRVLRGRKVAKERAVLRHRLIAAADVLEIVGEGEEHLVAALVLRERLEEACIGLHRPPPDRVAGPVVGAGRVTRGLDLASSERLALLPVGLAELEEQIRLAGPSHRGSAAPASPAGR